MDDEVSHSLVIDGRYALYGPIAAGGMATVHFGRLLGSGGFTRTVAIKRLRGEFLDSPEFVSTLLDEARLASRIRHPNVVATLDMVAAADEVFLVMEYVVGESLSRMLNKLSEQGRRIALPIAAAVLTGVLDALHAAHEAKDELGEPLGIVHRDVSPQNVLVGTDGLARLLDFGVAKGKGRLQVTRAGQLKGKVGYMAPEQILGEEPDRRSDVYAAAVVFWEVLTCQRLFPSGQTPGENFNLIPRILEADVKPPSAAAAWVPSGLDAIVMRALNRERDARYATAREFAVAIEEVTPIASSRRVGQWVESVAAEALAERARQLQLLERASHQRSALAAPVVDAAMKARQRKRLASEPTTQRRARPGQAGAISDMATAVDDPSADAPPDSELEVSTAVRALPGAEHKPSTRPRGTPATPFGKRTQTAGSPVAIAEARRLAQRARDDTARKPLAETVEDVPSDVGRAAAAMGGVDSPDDDTATLNLYPAESDTLRKRPGVQSEDPEEFKSTLVSVRRDEAGSDFEGPEPATLVSQKSLDVKGPPGLPADEDSWDRASGEVDSRNAPTAKARLAHPSAPIPSDVPPMERDELSVPVSSNAWIWIVLLLLAIGGGAAYALL